MSRLTTLTGLEQGGWRKGRQAALPVYEAVLEHKDGTLTEHRAALASALIRSRHSDLKSQQQALATLNGLVNSGVDNEFVHGARIAMARIYMANDHKEKAIALLVRMPTSAGAYKTIADHYTKQWAAQAAD